MNEIFLAKLGLSFIIGGAWVTFATIAAERLGTKIGGIIAGAPSMISIALFFIGWTQTPSFASQATTIIPITMGINTLFVIIYVVLSRFNFYLSILTSLIFWFTLTLLLVFLKFDNFICSIVVYIACLAFSYYILEKRMRIKSETQKNIQYSLLQLIFRISLSGGIITLAVLMAEVGGPLFGGAFSAFPAVVLSIIILTYFAQGKSFSSATLKVMVLGGGISLVIYAVVVRYAYLHIGLIWGTLLAYLVSIICAYFLYLYVRKIIS
ncbi:DUF3147 family protein [Chloroflexota bacterium]